MVYEKMLQNSVQISAVPTNIITGFLGAGKTSTIVQLLKSKPEHERWAILVNEFGEIGIDGALFEGQHSEQNGVYIREVPGGCMCCTAGLPMRVALTQLLRRARPDRLLIEATGLGHPEEVLQTLSDEDFRGVIEIQKVLTLVDARQLSDERYLEHETFQQQMATADIVVANKQDLYSEQDKAALELYLQKHSLHDVKLVFAKQGDIEHTLLDGTTQRQTNATLNTQAPSMGRNKLEPNNPQDNSKHFIDPIPECGFVKALNQGEGFTSAGWRFASRIKFDRNKLFAFLSGMDVERLKATFITSEGCFAYNLTKDACTEIPFDYLDESRIEIIAREQDLDWETSLFNCMSNQNSISETNK